MGASSPAEPADLQYSLYLAVENAIETYFPLYFETTLYKKTREISG